MGNFQKFQKPYKMWYRTSWSVCVLILKSIPLKMEFLGHFKDPKWLPFMIFLRNTKHLFFFIFKHTLMCRTLILWLTFECAAHRKPQGGWSGPPDRKIVKLKYDHCFEGKGVVWSTGGLKAPKVVNILRGSSRCRGWRCWRHRRPGGPGMGAWVPS